MKKLFLILTIITCNIAGMMAQSAGFSCDLASTGVELRNASGSAIVSNIAVGSPGIIRLRVVNAGSAIGSCSYQPGEVQVVAAFPAPSSSSYYYKYDGPTTFSTAKYTWTYDMSTSELKGVNNVAIFAGFGGFETVDIPIAGVATGNYILGIDGVVFASASPDDTNNNYWEINVNVVAPISLPLTITDYNGFAVNCDATLKWATSFESNVSRFEIEQSTNGTFFSKVGTIQALNVTNGGSYQFNYSQGNGNFYYRLKMIDRDGSYVYSKIINIQSDCKVKKIVKVYPNPVITNQLLQVNLSGFEKNLKGDLITVTGQVVKTYNLTNGNNPLDVSRIAQGTYTLRITENGVTQETIKVSVMQ